MMIPVGSVIKPSLIPIVHQNVKNPPDKSNGMQYKNAGFLQRKSMPNPARKTAERTITKPNWVRTGISSLIKKIPSRQP
jgi:hypothetical protein